VRPSNFLGKEQESGPGRLKVRELAKEDPEYLNAHRYLGIIHLEKEEF
jgi:hypothetical protein